VNSDHVISLALAAMILNATSFETKNRALYI
jgi:hypothetical protein